MSNNNGKLNIEQLDTAMKKSKVEGENLKWYSPKEKPFRLAGFPWMSIDGVYRRLPLQSDYGIPKNVDILADCTAGGQVSFCTDSSKLVLKVELTEAANMDHMPATGQCGFDCYIGKAGSKRYYSTVRHDHTKNTYESQLFDNLGTELKDITLNFPLYTGVRQVRIGLECTSKVYEPSPYTSDGRVVFYGTSITQGGCASRPGMAYTNILSRKLNCECVNLGFSGNGKGEPEVAKVISDIKNPLCYILDYEANANFEGILEKTLREFIGVIRDAHPDTPILVISKIQFAKENFNSMSFNELVYLRSFQSELVEGLRNGGDQNIYFCSGMDLLGNDFEECTVDGVHPTDLGFWRIAEKLEPIIRGIIHI